MRAITSEALAGLDGRCAQILSLTTEANQLLADLRLAEPIRSEYAEAGFVKVPNVAPAGALTGLLTDLLPILSPIAEEVSLLHAPTAQHTLSDGARFRRVDPHFARQPATREKLTCLLDSLGLLEFGFLLGTKLTPLIRYVVGPVSFQRVYFYLYREGDYISVHDDHHVGARVDVQFPVSIGTVAGVRVLSEGFLRMHYDSPGSMNILGPCVWHDVPPVLRGLAGVDPQRINIGLRFARDSP